MTTINLSKQNSNSLQLWAVIKGDAEVQKILSEAQIEPNIRDKKDRAASILAIEWSSEEISLINCNKHTDDKEGDYSLLAIPQNSNEIVKMLLENGTSLSIGFAGNDTSWITSIKEHYADLPAKFLKATKPDLLDNRSVSILIWVVSESNINLKNLCSNDKKNNSLLLIAAQEFNFSELRKLLKKCANPDLRDENGDTALMLAIKNTPDHDNTQENNQNQIDREEKLKQTVLVLLANAANPDLRDENGDTALMLAVEKNFRYTSAALLTVKADIYIKDKYNMTVFERMQNDHDKANDVIIEALLEIAGEEALSKPEVG